MNRIHVEFFFHFDTNKADMHCYFFKLFFRPDKLYFFHEYDFVPLAHLDLWEKIVDAAQSSRFFDETDPRISFSARIVEAAQFGTFFNRIDPRISLSTHNLPDLQSLLRYQNFVEQVSYGRDEQWQAKPQVTDIVSEQILPAANKGYAFAQKLLGDYYTSMPLSGPQYSEDIGLKYYKMAALHGLASNLFLWGNRHEPRKYVIGNISPSEVFACYRDAANHGDLDAMERLAWFYIARRRTEKDALAARAFALDIFQCEPHWESAHAIIGLYLRQQSADIDKKEVSGLYFYLTSHHSNYNPDYERIIETGLAAARCELASRYETGRGIERNLSVAARIYREAAEKGAAAAQYGLARCCETGAGTQRDMKLAVRLYRLAAKQGHIESMESLMRCYLIGKGVRQDRERAKMWAKRAALAKNDHQSEEKT